MKMKSSSEVAAKWARVTPGRTSEYQAGVQNPRVSWSAATVAAADNFKAGVTAAIASGAFERGVKAAGDSLWQQNAANIGPARFAEGVANAQPRFEAGFAPYAQVLASTTLPPRFPKGDPRNLKRVEAVTMALRKRKTGGA
jgi:hypothetical protein